MPIVVAGVHQLDVTRRIAGGLEGQRESYRVSNIWPLARNQPGQPNGIVGARFAAGHQQDLLVGQRGHPYLAAKRIQRTGAAVHALIAIIHQIVKFIAAQGRLRPLHFHHRSQRRRRRYAERRLFPLADPCGLAPHPLLLAINKQQGGFEPLQRNSLETLFKRDGLRVLHLLQECVNGDVIVSFQQFVGNLPVCIAQGQGFAIELKPGRYRRQRRHRVAHASQLNTQADAGCRSGAAGKGHHQAVV